MGFSSKGKDGSGNTKHLRTDINGYLIVSEYFMDCLHTGKLNYYANFFNVAAGGEETFTIYSPNNDVHFWVEVECANGDTTYDVAMYVNNSVTTLGTEIIAFNRNLTMGVNGNVKIYQGSTISGGTQVFGYKLVSKRRTKGATPDYPPLILPKEQYHTIKITNSGSSSADFNIILTFVVEEF